MIETLRQDGEGSCSLILRLAHLGTYVAGKTQTMRTRMTVKLVSSA
jgi:hypothetical protein